MRVVAGEVCGVQGPVTDIAADPLYLDVQISPGELFVQPIPEGYTALAYLYHGKCEFVGSQVVEAVRMIALSDGDHLKVQTASDSPAHFMLVAGAPFREPIVPYGPFVMNTVEEIQQTLEELRNGTFVSEAQPPAP